MTKMQYLTDVVANNYLTVQEAAQELNISQGVLRNYLNLDKLTTYKFKTLTLLSKSEVENWKVRQNQ